MEILTVSLDKEILFNRCHTDVSVRGRQLDLSVQMCEHDRAWFEISLVEAANVVAQELSRIAKEVTMPISNTEAQVSFSVRPVNHMQENLLPYAIERAVIDHIVGMWYSERITTVVDSSKSLLNLKYITLISNGASRKPNY